jgi:AraC-like DNA-binding protein
MTDPLAQVVALLRPDLSSAKFIEASGAWQVRRSEEGRAIFCAVLDGAVQVEIDGGSTLRVEGGDFLLIPHAFNFTFSSTFKEAGGRADALPREVRPGIFRLGESISDPDLRMLVGYCSFGSTDASLLVSLLPSLVHARGDPRLTTLIQLAVDESRADRAARAAILGRLMEIIFMEALRSPPRGGPSGFLRGLADDRVAAALRLIHSEPTAAWTVDGLAKAVAMSRSAFFARFRRVVSMAPMEYLLHWRMVLAKQILERGPSPITEVARAVGYGSASAFSVAFNRHVGVPPGRYARR